MHSEILAEASGWFSSGWNCSGHLTLLTHSITKLLMTSRDIQVKINLLKLIKNISSPCLIHVNGDISIQRCLAQVQITKPYTDITKKSTYEIFSYLVKVKRLGYWVREAAVIYSQVRLWLLHSLNLSSKLPERNTCVWYLVPSTSGLPELSHSIFSFS